MPGHHIRFYGRFMRSTDAPSDRWNDAGLYEIRLAGHLEARWTAWFDGMVLTQDNVGTTVIRGPVVDQAALHGLLHKVRDLGLPLVSVTRVDLDRPSTEQGA